MVNYEEAIKRPFQDIKKLLIGSILALIPIVNFMLSGYALKCAKGTLNKDNSLPEWEDWGNLFIKGIVVVIIGFIYFIPAGIVLIGGMGTIILGAVVKGTMDSATIMAAIGSGGIVLLIVGILYLIASLIVPIAIMRYVDKEDFGAAFSLGTILKKVFTGNYLVSWIIVVVCSIVISMFSFIIPVVGSAIAIFIISIMSMTIFAEAYLEE